jgi:hypothetical protein
MFTDRVEIYPELIELRQRANYWRLHHGDAIKRESAAKGDLRELKQVVCRQQRVIEEQSQQIEMLKAKVALLQQQVVNTGLKVCRQSVGADDHLADLTQRA